MSNGNEPAMPWLEAITNVKNADSGVTESYMVGSSGLTKREHFAAMAMQGLLGTVNAEWYMHKTPIEKLVKDSVAVADALLEELEK